MVLFCENRGEIQNFSQGLKKVRNFGGRNLKKFLGKNAPLPQGGWTPLSGFAPSPGKNPAGAHAHVFKHTH